MGKPEKLNSFLLELNKTCERTGKDSEDLTVLGASKSQEIDSIELALAGEFSTLERIFFKKLNQKY